jgi:O-antigen/teichoic acid export membrane protein
MAKSVKLNVVFKSVLSICNIVIPLITAPYIARILSIDGFTEYNRIVTIMAWLSPIAVFGVYTYGVRAIAQVKQDMAQVRNLFTRLFLVNVFTCSILCGICIITFYFVPSFNNYRSIYLVSCVQIIAIIFAIEWINEAFENYGFILLKTLICKILYIAAIFLFVRKEDDVLIYVIIASLSVMFNNICSFIYVKVRITFTRVNFSDIWNLTKPLFLIFLLFNSSMLYTLLDRLFLTLFSNKLNLTYYTISQTIPNAIITVTSSIILVTLPRLSSYYANNKKGDYYSLLHNSANIFLLINTPACIGMACLSNEIILLYAGNKYIEASSVLFLFSVRYLISTFDMILSKQVLFVTGNEKILTRIYYVGGGFNIIIKAILIFFDNLTPESCIISTAAADIMVIALQYKEIRNLKIDFQVLNISTIKYILFSLLFIPINSMTKLLFPDGAYSFLIRLVLMVVSCFFVYTAALFISRDKIFILLLKQIINKNK